MLTLYRLTFESGKVYIGQTVRKMKTRLSQHRLASRSGSMLPVHCAWRAHGDPALDIIGTYDSEDDLHAAEIAAIIEHNSVCPNGYNLSAGGTTAPSKNPEVAAKIGAKATGRKHKDTAQFVAISKAHWLDPEYRKKVSDGLKASWTEEGRKAAGDRARARKGLYPRSEETKAKLRAAKANMSAETRRKMSESAKLRIRQPWDDAYKAGAADRAAQQHAQRAIARGEKPTLRGVSRNRAKWSARIRINGKVNNLGTFSTPELAHAAYMTAKQEAGK